MVNSDHSANHSISIPPRYVLRVLSGALLCLESVMITRSHCRIAMVTTGGIGCESRPGRMAGWGWRVRGSTAQGDQGTSHRRGCAGFGRCYAACIPSVSDSDKPRHLRSADCRPGRAYKGLDEPQDHAGHRLLQVGQRVAGNRESG